MTNLLIHEYDNALAERAALFGAEDGATVRRHEAHWKAALSGCSLSISLDFDRQCDYLTPRLRMGSSSTFPGDPMLALAVLRDAEATIHRALAAFVPLAGLRVWSDAAPCDWCSATGKSGSHACERCEGTGKRTHSRTR